MNSKTITLAKHIAHAASDWTDLETGDHAHTPECSNWEAYVRDASNALAALVPPVGEFDGVEARYPIPAPVDFTDDYSYVIQVVFIQGKRQGYLDAQSEKNSDEWERFAFYDPRVKDEYQ